MKYFLIAILIIVLAVLALVYYLIYMPVDVKSEESVVFLVKKGEGLNQIAENLKEQGLIKSKYSFIAYTLYKKQEKELIAGGYQLFYSMNIPEILKKISSGDRIKIMVTIIEGWTIKDIEQKLNMGLIDPSLEGYLFPDTYEIYLDDKLEDIIKKMQDNFDKKITNEIRQEINSQQKSLEQIIIMASILEKEVQTSEDKKIVSGILWKRIEMGMLLQVDAVPFTYEVKGLPPAPICNPGLLSIEAALYPIKSKYLYYLSTQEGETIFSTTLAEHEDARQKYLK